MADCDRARREDAAQTAALKRAKHSMLRQRVAKYMADGLSLTATAEILGVSTTLVKRLRAKLRDEA